MDFVVCCMTHECVSGSIGLHCSTMSAKNETRVILTILYSCKSSVVVVVIVEIFIHGAVKVTNAPQSQLNK